MIDAAEGDCPSVRAKFACARAVSQNSHRSVPWLFCGKCLVAESEAGDDLFVFLLRAFFDEIQHLAALGNHGQQAAAGREVLLVDVEVIRQMEDPLGEQSHLIGCAAGVSFVELIVFQVDFFGIAHGLRGWVQRVPDRPWLV